MSPGISYFSEWYLQYSFYFMFVVLKHIIFWSFVGLSLRIAKHQKNMWSTLPSNSSWCWAIYLRGNKNALDSLVPQQRCDVFSMDLHSLSFDLSCYCFLLLFQKVDSKDWDTNLCWWGMDQSSSSSWNFLFFFAIWCLPLSPALRE